VAPAFFSLARPNIQDQVAELASRGIRRILVMPYFLYAGQHVTHDIPGMLAECRDWFPEIELELLPTLENDLGVEDVVVERLAAQLPGQTPPAAAAAIQQQSYEIIDRQIGSGGPQAAGQRRIIRRIVHATADLSFARTVRIHEQAVACGLSALAAGRPVVCDVKMVRAGLTKVRNPILCAIDSPDAAQRARQQGCTRAAAAMELLRDELQGSIVAIGNAPTALWKVLEIARGGGPRPALVVGLPVGLVGARESKQALLESDLCYITNVGPRGGSAVAAAAMNALATMAERQ
jgi:precorrin-8X/cobalt-precorrin-8 methylmutase